VDFCPEVFGPVKICCGEVVEPPGGIPVLSWAKVFFDDRTKLQVLKEISHQTV
jgi:hypothetical protein